MKIYNTLSRQVEEVIPLKTPLVTVYTCGPTVYDHPHIGNWYNYVRMDMLIRTLRSAGLTQKWVMNITDVGHLTSDADEGQDKLEKAAQRESKTAWAVAAIYSDEFMRGLSQLNILTPDIFTKATEHIPEQINLIARLEEKGYVYVIDDGVYYDTSKFPHYPDFARLELDEDNARTRVGLNKQKKQAWDFALWKFTPPGQKRDMEWDSPWGKGFPGWHIECSAMSMKYLGETIDIHTGGIDHVPVHHTNEIAQSEAATGKRYANYWLHSNHVLVEDQKISKSLGNSITLEDIAKAGYSSEELRLHILESHYRSHSKFSYASLEAAKNRLRDLKATAVLRYQAKTSVHDASTFTFRDIPDELSLILQNDLNTPEALSLLSNISTQLQTVLLELHMVDHFEAMLEGIDKILGTKLSDVRDISTQQYTLIKLREQARENKDFPGADNIRQDLEKQGIGLRDTKAGAVWFYT